MSVIKYFRGGIYFADLGINKGSEQSNTRPVVVVSNDLNNAHSNIVTIIPITSADKTQLPIHVTVPCVQNGSEDTTNTVLCEQIRAISIARMKNFIGVFDAETMKCIDEAIKIQLNLTELKPNTTFDTTQQCAKELFPAYTDEYKRKFMKETEKYSMQELAKKYNITTKAAYARKANWINYK